MANALVENFQQASWDNDVLGSDVPVLVDFTAVWCGPCKMIAPHIDALATEYQGRVKVGKCDVDHNQQVAMRYRVSSIPAILIFKNGKVAGQVVGAVPKSRLTAMVEDALSKAV